MLFIATSRPAYPVGVYPIVAATLLQQLHHQYSNLLSLLLMKLYLTPPPAAATTQTMRRLPMCRNPSTNDEEANILIQFQLHGKD